MKRTSMLGSAMLIGWLGLVPASQAQVFVRAPFVRVWVGDGVSVRAPFVNLWIPNNGPAYYRPFGAPVFYPPPPVVVQSPPAFVEPMPPATELPRIVDQNAPPQPVQPNQVQTLEAFAKSFQAKAGAYEVTLLNPVTKQPTMVRFTLPQGTPRRINKTRDSVEFFYGLRQWVRLEFDQDGVIVTSR